MTLSGRLGHASLEIRNPSSGNVLLGSIRSEKCSWEMFLRVVVGKFGGSYLGWGECVNMIWNRMFVGIDKIDIGKMLYGGCGQKRASETQICLPMLLEILKCEGSDDPMGISHDVSVWCVGCPWSIPPHLNSHPDL